MKIVYFAPIEYKNLKQRPQYIAEELSKNHEVWYIEPTISIIGALKYKKDYQKRCYDVSSTLHIVRLDGSLTLPLRYLGIDRLNLATLFEKRQLKKMIPEADLWWVGYESWGRFLTKSSPRLVYDKMDDNVLMKSNRHIKKNFRRWEKEIIDHASIVFVTARKFYEELSKIHPNVHLLPNAVDSNATHEYMIASKNKRKIFGYVGMIDSWFDFEAIRKIALSNPDSIVELVGPCNKKEEMPSNVFFRGRVPKADVNKWISSFDVCLYPFKKDDFLDTINPVKIYEYLYMNKPVIAVSSMETRQFIPLIHCYEDYEELDKLVCDCLKVPFSTQKELKDFVDRNSWKNRGKLIDKTLKETFL